MGFIWLDLSFENEMLPYYRLTGVTLRAPQFEIRWKYTDVLLHGLLENNVSRGHPSQFKSFDNLFLIDGAFVIVFNSIAKFILVS